MDTINPAEYDTRIVIESSTTIIDDFGTPVKTWSELCKAWAKWQWGNAAENVTMNQLATDLGATVTIRYRGGINNTCRVKLGNDYYYVSSVTPSMRQGPIEMQVSKRDGK